MNYFSHAVDYLHAPLFMAGTAVPDMLSVIDRKVRVRSRHLKPLWYDSDPDVVEIARGIHQHLEDDRWFHANLTFQQLNLQFSQSLREVNPDDQSMRPRFLGHILIELILDALLISQRPGQLEEYYEKMEQVDSARIQAVINRVARTPTYEFVRFFEAFCRERFLFDYGDDERLAYRLNQVMNRVGLEPLGDPVVALFPGFRQQVSLLQHELLTPDTIHSTNQEMISEEEK